MDYKVNKLTFLTSSNFNVKEEAEDICKLCKVTVPKNLNFVGPVCVGDIYIDLCPRCARGIRNLVLKQPPETQFPGDETNRRYNKFLSWQIQQEKEK